MISNFAIFFLPLFPGAMTARTMARMPVWAILSGLALYTFAMLVLFWSIKRKRDRRQSETERLLRIAEESNRILRQDFERERRDLLDQIKAYSQQADEACSDQAALAETLESLRKSFAVTYKEKFTAVGELCAVWMASKNRSDRTEIVYRKVEQMISNISDENKLHRKFENQINQDLDDIVKHLKEDLGIVDKTESRFICYCIVGFEPGMIAMLLGLTLSNVYTKKFRLKERIRSLDSPYKESYLRMI